MYECAHASKKNQTKAQQSKRKERKKKKNKSKKKFECRLTPIDNKFKFCCFCCYSYDLLFKSLTAHVYVCMYAWLYMCVCVHLYLTSVLLQIAANKAVTTLPADGRLTLLAAA